MHCNLSISKGDHLRTSRKYIIHSSLMSNLFQSITGPFYPCVDHDEKVLSFIEIFWTLLTCLSSFLQVFSLRRNEILKYHLQMGSKMPPKRLLCNSIRLQFFVFIAIKFLLSTVKKCLNCKDGHLTRCRCGSI